MHDIVTFLEESNRIEGEGPPSDAELAAAIRVVNRRELDIPTLSEYVRASSGARLRDQPGMNVRVGDHRPPEGGGQIFAGLQAVLDLENSRKIHPVRIYHMFQWLHPYTDGNGRAGRLIWLRLHTDDGVPGWSLERVLNLGFLQTFHYQTLAMLDRADQGTLPVS